MEEHVDLGRQQIGFMRLHHHTQAARFQQHHGADRIDPHAAHEFLGVLRIEVEFAPLINLAQRAAADMPL
jgi:hypothetical protein